MHRPTDTSFNMENEQSKLMWLTNVERDLGCATKSFEATVEVIVLLVFFPFERIASIDALNEEFDSMPYLSKAEKGVAKVQNWMSDPRRTPSMN